MPLQILVVDDDDSVRYTLRALLEDEGHSVTTAANGETAIHLLQNICFQVVIADIWMPGMTGLDLLSTVQGIDPDLPVILLTGNASLETSIEAINRGACAYLLKPFVPDAIISAVARCIRKVDDARQRQADEQTLLHRLQELENYMLYLQGSQQGMNAETITIISDLIRGLRHELGNLATVLSLDVSLLEQTMTDSRLDRNSIEELKTNVDDLGRLLTRLKEYPQPRAQLAPVDLAQIAFDAVEDRRKYARSLNMLIDCELPENGVYVKGDESGLHRVLINILDNALEANRQTHNVHVRLILEVTPKEAFLKVVDEGPGFASKLLDEAFSPAYTTKITDGFMRGLGMGLFVSHAIVSLHNGTIALSNVPTGGAQVTISLPLLEEQSDR